MVPDHNPSDSDSTISTDADDSPPRSADDPAVESRTDPTTAESVEPMSTETATSSIHGNSTGINALIGAIAGIVLSFIPLSTVLGGAIAGYLEGGTPEDGLRVGAIAGAIMLLPFALFGLVALFLFGFFGGAPFFFLFVGGAMFTVAVVYTVGFGALGGYLGRYLRDER